MPAPLNAMARTHPHTPTQRAAILAERSQAFLSLGDLPASRADAEHAVLEDRFWAEGCVRALLCVCGVVGAADGHACVGGCA